MFGLDARLRDTRWPRLVEGSVIVSSAPRLLEEDRSSYPEYLLNFPVLETSAANFKWLRDAGKSDVYLLTPDFLGKSIRIPGTPKRIDLLVVGDQRAQRVVADARRLGLVAVQTAVASADALAQTRLAALVRRRGADLHDIGLAATIASSGVELLMESTVDSGENDALQSFAQIGELEALARCALDRLAAPTGGVPRNGVRAAPCEGLADFLEDNRVQSHSSVGGMLALRNSVVSGVLTANAGFLELLDYALGWHDRHLDVEDVISNYDSQLTDIPLIVLLELFSRGSLPASLEEMVGYVLGRRLTPANLSALPRHFQQVAAAALARLGRGSRFLEFVVQLPDSVEVAASSLGRSTITGAERADIVHDLLATNDGSASTRHHLAAEFLWQGGQTAAAARCYASPQARDAVGVTEGHLVRVAERLDQFGDGVLASTYRQLAGFIDLPLPRLDDSPRPARQYSASDVGTALQRNDCMVGHPVAWDGAGIIVNGSPQHEDNLLLNAGLKIWDARFGQATSRKESAKVIALIACYNEVDVIESVVMSFVSQGVRVHVIDNWSNDGTWEMLNLLRDVHKEIVLERYPKVPSGVFDWSGLLRRKEDIALGYEGFWVIHTDADEIRRSPWSGLTLGEALSVADAFGANAVDFAVFNFRPVDDGFKPGVDLESYFQYFEVADTADLRYQIKCWKQGQSRADLVSRGGHSVVFPSKRVFPIKFICKHYPLRSKQHAQRKIDVYRNARISAVERGMGWHTHYDHLDSQKCEWNWKELLRFTDLAETELGSLLIHGLD